MNSKIWAKLLAAFLAFALTFADVAILGSGISTAISTRYYKLRRTKYKCEESKSRI